MLGSTFVETAIGLSLLYLMLSMLCSLGYEWMAKQSMLRARMLRKTVEELLGAAACDAFYQHAVIRGLGTTETGRNPFRVPLLKSFQGIVSWWKPAAPSEVKGQRPAREEVVWLEPSYIPSTSFASVVRELEPSHVELAKPLNALRAGLATTEAQDAAVAKWFDDVMARLSSRYKRITQTWTLVIAVPLVLVLNVDTLLIAHRLQRDTPLREGIVKSAEAFVKDHPEITAPATPAPATSAAPTSAAPQSRFIEMSVQLDKLALPIGWPSDADVKEAQAAAKGAKATLAAAAEKATSTRADAAKALADAEGKSTGATGKLSASREKARALRQKESAERAAVVKDPKDPTADAREAAAKRERELAKLAADDAKADADEAKVDADEARTKADKAVADRDKARTEASAARLADEAARLERDDIDLRAWTPWGGGSTSPPPSRRLIGWLLTALALSLGASFWFDTLGKLFSIRGAGEKAGK